MTVAFSWLARPAKSEGGSSSASEPNKVGTVLETALFVNSKKYRATIRKQHNNIKAVTLRTSSPLIEEESTEKQENLQNQLTGGVALNIVNKEEGEIYQCRLLDRIKRQGLFCYVLRVANTIPVMDFD